MNGRLQFNRHELAGAFGDLGTSLPLIVAVLVATKLPATGVLLAFGMAQIATGVLYGLPMSVQPLKAMSVVAIAGGASGGMLQLAGFIIGVVMVALSATGALGWLHRFIPLCVVRGLQVGLGLILVRTASRLVIQDSAPHGWAIAAAAVALLVLMRNHRRWPGALMVVGAGVAWAAAFRIDWQTVGGVTDVTPPQTTEWSIAQWATVLTALVVPQLPLSLGNSVLATQQAARDLFPDRAFTLRKIGLTYGLINMVAPWLGGLPVCHGCGGLVGNYALGARTGGAVVIYGTLFVAAGLFGGAVFMPLAQAFPSSILGALLVVEAGSLVALLRGSDRAPAELALIVGVALVCVLTPQGYVLGLAIGVAAYYGLRAFGTTMAAESRA